MRLAEQKKIYYKYIGNSKNYKFRAKARNGAQRLDKEEEKQSGRVVGRRD